MVNDRQTDKLYDEDDLDPEEETPVYAADTFPWWGRALAWLTWRCPMWIYGLDLVGGVVWCLMGHPGKGTALGLLSLTLIAYCVYARKMQPDPFRYMILLSQTPLPPEDIEAAASGRPVPTGPKDRAQEKQT